MKQGNRDRRLDVTLGVHLEGNDTRSETDDIVTALQEAITGLEFVVPRRGVMRVVLVDDPIHVHNVQQGAKA